MRVVVTGGAGFIGSHMVASAIERGHEVVVIDDLSGVSALPLPSEVTFLEAEINDSEAVRRALSGAEVVFHLAAKRAVSRSVEFPLETDRVNTAGTLTVLNIARDLGVRRVVAASSSSVYGGSGPLPSTEDGPVAPKSPYAVSKLAGEHYARVFAGLYGLEAISLRFFNVFGPGQRPDGLYAAVIPIFLDALRSGRKPVVHGDGTQGRDFTYVSNVVDAMWLAALAPSDAARGNVYNVACGESHTVLALLKELMRIVDMESEIEFGDPRPGDVRDSLADVSRAKQDLGYEPKVAFQEGLEQTVDWFVNQR
jgi:UDP-glucose 4-epimerase